MHILVLNVGSSTLKFQLIDTDEASIAEARDRCLAGGQIERIGGEAIVELGAAGRDAVKTAVQLRNHAAAVEYVIDWLAMGTVGGRVQNATWRQLVENVAKASGGTAPNDVQQEIVVLDDARAAEVEHWLESLVAERKREQREESLGTVA